MKHSYLLLLAVSLAASAQVPDLRGIWQAKNNANANLESANVIVDPPGGKIPYLPGALATRQQNFANRATVDPETKCFQPGVPRATYVPTPFQIFQNAGAVYIVYQDVHAYRIIYLDGTPHNQGLGYAMGDSRGRWEGDTLVVDVTNQNEKTWFDMAGNFHSDALHVVERYTPVDANTIHYEATLEDSRVYTRPWKIAFDFGRNPDPAYEQMEYACVEGERDLQHYTQSEGATKGK
jgi:hypothetical protein